jgi:hypothetical protein
MRKGFDGLSALVTEGFGALPLGVDVQAGAVPMEDFGPHPIAAHEDIEVAAEWIAGDLLISGEMTATGP